jgi:PadR family transcriptional regulator, regulatory protein PadR
VVIAKAINTLTNWLMPMKDCCDMKGFLSFIVLRLISANDLSGEEVRKELERRKGSKPSPGTIYPVLKDLRRNGWIRECPLKEKMKRYCITPSGKREVRAATRRFTELFCDMGIEFRK